MGGKPIRDCYEATGHAKAYDDMLTVARGGELSITKDVIRRLHRLFYHGIDPDAAGQYRTGQVFITGTEYVPPAAEDVPACMTAFVAELPQKQEKMHPVEFAAYAHRRLVGTHPFQDMLNTWRHEAEKLERGEITGDEYDRWRYAYPQVEAERTRATMDRLREKKKQEQDAE